MSQYHRRQPGLNPGDPGTDRIDEREIVPGVSETTRGSAHLVVPRHRLLWSFIDLGGDRRHPPFPGPGASMLLSRADPVGQPVGVDRALWADQQGGVETSTMDPNRAGPCSQTIQSGQPAIEVPFQDREEERETEGYTAAARKLLHVLFWIQPRGETCGLDRVKRIGAGPGQWTERP